MKTPSRKLFALGALLAAFVSSASAQLVTFQTQTGYGGSVQTFLAASSQTQVFTNVSAIKSLTYNFFVGSANSNQTTSSTTLAATFGQWNGTSFIGSPLSLGQITINPSHISSSLNTPTWNGTLSYVDSNNVTQNTGSYTNTSYTFDFTGLSGANPSLGYLTNPNASYALTLSYVSGDTNLALGTNTGSSFVNGYQAPFNPAVFGAGFNGYDFVFSAISIVPGTLVPTPEASTVASIVAAALVAGLVFLRMRQRRLAPVPVAMA